jgi:hypothetical protein
MAGQAPRAADPGDLLGEDNRLEKAETVAAVFLGQGAAEKTEPGHLLDQFGAEPVIRFVFLERGQDFVVGEILRHLLHHPLFFRQSEVHLGLLRGHGAVRTACRSSSDGQILSSRKTRRGSRPESGWRFIETRPVLDCTRDPWEWALHRPAPRFVSATKRPPLPWRLK